MDEGLPLRVEALATWLGDLDARVQAAELATGDQKTAKELRRAVEALAKHDPKLESRLTDRVDVLADRLATLASTVSTTASSLAGRDGEIAALRRDLEEGSRRIEALVLELGRTAGAADVEKLRVAIEKVAAERQARTGDERVEELGRKIGLIAGRLDTLGRTVATTEAGLASREGEVAALRHRLEADSAQLKEALGELRLRHGDAELESRLDSLAEAVAATTTGLAGRESEIAAVRARLDEAYSRIGSVIADIQQAIGALSAQVSAFEKFPEAAERAFEGRAAELHAKVDALAERLETVASSVESATSGLAQRELELAALRHEAAEAESRVEAVLGELKDALAGLPAAGTVDPELDARLLALAGMVSAVSHRLELVESASDEGAVSAASRANELEGLIAEIGERLDAVDRDRNAVATQLTRVQDVWAEERAWVRGRLEELVAAQTEASQANEGLGPLLEEATARLYALEGDRDAMAAELTRVVQLLDAESESLQAQVSALAATLEQNASSGANEESERQLSDIAGRLDSVERSSAAVASEIARTASYWTTELESIEARLVDRVAEAKIVHPAAGVDEEAERLRAELVRRLDAMERDREQLAAELARLSETWISERSSLHGRLDQVATQLAQVGPTATRIKEAPASDEVAQLRMQIEGLRMRLASNEQEITALAASRDIAPRLDELGRRIDIVERTGGGVMIAGSGGAVAGDGRFRLELRALELRMEHAEAASRENREAVLVQLERLAARVEWRLQRLEAVEEGSYPQAVGSGAQVVPIRGGADV